MLRIDVNLRGQNELAKSLCGATFDRLRKVWQVLGEDWDDPKIQKAIENNWIPTVTVTRMQANNFTDSRDEVGVFVSAPDDVVNNYSDLAIQMGGRVVNGCIEFNRKLAWFHFNKICIIKQNMQKDFTTFANLPYTVTENDVFLDTETTGLDTNDEIISIGIVDCYGDKMYESLFRPQVFVDPGASHCNNLYNDSLVAEPAFKDEWDKVRELLQGKRVHIFNSDFDTRLLDQTLKRYELQGCEFSVVDSMKVFNDHFGRKMSLQKVVDALKFAYVEKHTAADDAWLILKCYHEAAKKGWDLSV